MEYSQFFIQTQRFGGGDISIIDPRQFTSFLKAVAEDQDLCDELKIFLFVSLSGALRVTECLELQACSFQKKANGNYAVTSKVLKKREKATRSITLHPVCNDYIDTILLNKRHFEHVLSERIPGVGLRRFTRHDIRYRLDKAFGVDHLCPHSLRHSLISYLVHVGKTELYIATLLKLSANVVKRYSHLDGATEFEMLYA